MGENHQAALDDSLAMQLISVRLTRALIEDLKFIANREGLGYQPLMRRVLLRFTAAEFKSIAHEKLLSETRQATRPIADTEEQSPLADCA